MQAPDAIDQIGALWAWLQLTLAVSIMERWARARGPESSAAAPQASGAAATAFTRVFRVFVLHASGSDSRLERPCASWRGGK